MRGPFAKRKELDGGRFGALSLNGQGLTNLSMCRDGEWNRIFNISVAQCGDVLWSQRRDLPILL